MPSAETLDPRRTKLQAERLLAIVISRWSTAGPVKVDSPYTDNELPNRAQPLTVRAPARYPQLSTLSVPPTRAADETEQILPATIVPAVESWDDKITRSRADTVDPPRRAFETLMQLPVRTNDRTDSELEMVVLPSVVIDDPI